MMTHASRRYRSPSKCSSAPCTIAAIRSSRNQHAPCPLVCVTFDALAQLRAAGGVGIFLTGELQLGPPPGHDVGGERVGQTEGDELYGTGLVEMGEGLEMAVTCR